MTDPRITDDEDPAFAAAFDKRDAAAGVVRVDTRNPATIERIARLLAANEPYNRRGYREQARDVLAALTEGEAQ